MGLFVDFVVNDLSVNVGLDKCDVVVLGVDLSVVIKVFVFKYLVCLKL